MHHLEAEVDVLHMDAKERADEQVVGERVDDALGALARAIEAEGADHVRLEVLHQVQRPLQLLQVEGQVDVRVHHDVLGGRGQAGAHGAAELEVDRVCDEAELGDARGELLADLLGPIRGRVVDDDDFEIIGQPWKHFHGAHDRALDVILFIPGGKEEADAGGRSHDGRPRRCIPVNGWRGRRLLSNIPGRVQSNGRGVMDGRASVTALAGFEG
jgi:hypothetical protein